MAFIAWSDVTTAVPGLSTVDPTYGALLASLANGFFDVDNLGGEAADKLRIARINLAAHLATLHVNGNGGAVISESIGGLSRSYQAPVVNAGELGATSYGMIVQLMIGTSPARCGLVI